MQAVTEAAISPRKVCLEGRIWDLHINITSTDFHDSTVCPAQSLEQCCLKFARGDLQDAL